MERAMVLGNPTGLSVRMCQIGRPINTEFVAALTTTEAYRTLSDPLLLPRLLSSEVRAAWKLQEGQSHPANKT